jgi:hypothetical protein
LIDSIDDFFFRIGEVEERDSDVKERSGFDEEARREVDGGEGNDDDGSMRNARIDRDDDSMNDLSEIDRRDFFRTKNLIDEFHLLN